MIPKIGQTVKINPLALDELRRVSSYQKDLDILDGTGGELWEASKATLTITEVLVYVDEYDIRTEDPLWGVILDGQGKYLTFEKTEYPLFKLARPKISDFVYCNCKSPSVKYVHMVNGAFQFCTTCKKEKQ